MSKQMLNKAIHHARNREYMSGIDRDKVRVKQTAEELKYTGEVFKA